MGSLEDHLDDCAAGQRYCPKCHMRDDLCTCEPTQRELLDQIGCPRVFDEIRIGNVGVMAAGGIVDISKPEDARENKAIDKPKWERRSYLGLNATNARQLARALLAAADACEGKL